MSYQCEVYLEGNLRVMPIVPKNKLAETDMLVTRVNHFMDQNEYFRVILDWHNAYHIVHYCYPGILLKIYADLRVRDEIEIVADKIKVVID